MKFEFLKYFTVLAEELHFGRAAGKLAITQPPLSAAIKSLEAEVGAQLFQRDRTSVRLTPAGAAFLLEARRILEGYSRAKGIAAQIERGVVGRLDVGFGVTLTYRGVLEIVDRFRAESPGVEVVLHDVPAAEQFDRLLHGELHAGFIVAPLAPPGLASIPLKDDHLVLCVPESHPRAGAPVIDLREVAKEPFLMFTRETGAAHYDGVLAVLIRAGIYPRFVYHTRGWLPMMIMISHGRGLGLVPSTLGQMKLPGVRLIPLLGPSTPVPPMLAWRPGDPHAALDKLIRCAAQIIAAQQPPFLQKE
jgi:DNA-binding transcriptional LysR family regulator